MEAIARIRQMMAESKFFEAQKIAELHLTMLDDPLRSSVLPLYLEILEQQDRSLPASLLLEAAENDLAETDKAQRWIDKIGDAQLGTHQRRLLLLKIALAEKKGRLDELYRLISDFQLYLFAARVPSHVPLIHDLIEKYFKGDFHLRLQELAVVLMLNDLYRAESLTRELIYSCVEKASPRGVREKLLAINEILATHKDKSILELYQNYCIFRAEGITHKAEYKKLAELFIYFEDFRLQVLLLDLLTRLELNDLAEVYAEQVKQHSAYDFVYLDKYFAHLKALFARAPRVADVDEAEKIHAPDLKLEQPLMTFKTSVPAPRPLEEEELLLMRTLKLHDHSVQTLTELAVSFLQSEYPRAAISAAELAMNRSNSDNEYLKAAYLRATGLYQICDYRACLDIALTALERAQSKDDILSFLYLQADVLTQLGHNKQAHIVLKKISDIDPSYRLTRERLKRLDEI